MKLEAKSNLTKRPSELQPDYAEAYLNIGTVFQDQSKLEEAIESYKKAISIKPDYAEAYLNIGTVFKDQGKLDEEAIEAYNKAISLKPDYTEAYYNMGLMHIRAENFEQAKICFEDALRINPNQNKLGLSLALQGLGRYEEAIDTVVWMVNKPREFQIS